MLNAQDDLLDFVRVTWNAVEPGRRFVHGWVVECIAEHLEAVAAGEITRLIMNVPPGFMKSLMTNVFFPAWVWTRKPSARFLCASYSSQLTERDNLRTCQVIHGETYKRYWGNQFTANESMVKIINNKTGFKLATSIGGVGTGERADFLLLDDPNSVKQAESKTIRDSTNHWLREVMPSRLNDPASSAIVLIQQRTHEDDATGTLLADDGGYEHVMIPMEWDGRRYVTSIGWTDPRSVEDIDPSNPDREWWRVRGELAFPERFPVHVVERDKKAIGSYAVASQYQQMPVPRGGGIIKRDWWGPGSPTQWGPDNPKGLKFPPFDTVVAFYDGAYTTKEQNDPSALAVLGVYRDNYPNPDHDRRSQLTGMPRVMLAHCWAERLALNDAVNRVDETCRKYRVSILLVENKANGLSVVQELHRLFRDKPYSIIPVAVGRKGVGSDKVARAMSVVPLFENGLVGAPNTEWAIAAQDECAIFPRGGHDDRVDAIVGGLLWMRQNGLILQESEHLAVEREELEEQEERGRQAPLYFV